MSVKFSDVMTKSDWLKMSVLLIVAVGCWIWVWTEYQKPMIAPDWESRVISQQ
ncbi:MAG: hypothetical protein WC768_02780 [Patescibacteria group bacterium]|jgi:hypothetical protein